MFGGGAGTSYSNVVDVYDSTNGTWATAHLSQAREDLAAASCAGEAFFGGGWNPGNGGASNTVDIYDLAAGTWSTATLSHGRDYLAAAAAGDKVLFAGGALGYETAPTNAVDIYDTDSGVWSTATLSQARFGLSAASVGNEILFAGGRTSNGWSSVVDIYNTVTNAWSTAALSQARAVMAATSVSNQVFFAGGYTGTSNTNVVDIYTLQSYPSISSTKIFNLQDNTTVAGLMQLNAPGSLGLSTFSLNVGSMGGNAPIDLGSQTLTVGSDNTCTTYTGIISDAGSLVKTGSGALTLAGSKTYSGPTMINQGKLTVDGWLSNSAVTVNSSGTLGGTGNVTSVTVYSGGHLAPGDLNAGTLIVAGNMDFEGGEFDVVGGGSSITGLSVAGNLSLNGNPMLDVTGSLVPGTYTLASYVGTLSGTFGTLNIPAGDTINYGTGSDSSITLSAVPESSTIALLAAGALGLVGYALRRRIARQAANRAALDQQADSPAILSFPSRSSAHAARRTA